MPSGINQYKLTAEQQNQVCSWIADGWTSRRIAEKVEEEYDIKISHIAIYEGYMHGKKWKPVIERFRKELIKNIMSVPIAQKKVRLREIEETINEAKRWRVDKLYFDKDGNEVGKVEKRNIGIIPALIKEARAEVEGDQDKAETNVYNIINYGTGGEVKSKK